MSNDLTIITFHGAEEDAVPRVTPAKVADIATRMQDCFRWLAQEVGVTASVELHFATTPRRGSLEIVLQHTFAVDQVVPAAQAALGRLADAVVKHNDLIESVGILYVMLFGGNRSLVDMFRRKSAPQSREVPQGGNAIEVLQLQFGQSALSDGNVSSAIEGLLTSAVTKGVKRVEIQIRDDPAVVIYESKDRADARLLAQSRNGLSDPFNNGMPTEITRVGDDSVAAIMGGKPTLLLLGTRYPMPPPHERVVIVWMADQEPPKPRQTFIAKGRVMDRSELSQIALSGPVPVEFEDAELLFRVDAAYF